MRLPALLLLCFASAASAQVSPGAVKPQPPEVPPVPSAPREGIELKAPAPAAPLILSAPVRVQSFRLVGAPAFHTEISALLAPYTGRTLTGVELAQAAEAVTAHLRDKGLLVAQAVIPPQEVRDGVVEMHVFEGKIGALRLEVAEDSRVRRAIAEGFVQELRPGETLRRDNVEQSLLLLNDLPGVRLSAQLLPGAEPGTVDIAAKLENDGTPIAGRLTLDNAGLYSTGEYRAILDVRMPSPLGIGDLLAGRLLQSNDDGQTLGTIVYGLPVNASGTRVGGRYSLQRYDLGKDFASLRGHGDSRAWSLLGSHPLLRRSDHNATAALSYTEVEYRDRLDAVGFANDTRHRIAALGVAAEERDNWLGRGVGALQVQYLYGRVLLDTQEIRDADSADGGLGVAGSFSVLRFRAQRAQALGDATRIQLALNGQWASKNLDAGNEIAVGGPDAVRAYPVGELYADQGVVGRAELVRDIGPFLGLRSAVSLFYDDSRVEVNRNALPGDRRNRRSLSGYGFGVSLEHTRNVFLQTWFAWRASSDEATAAPNRTPRIWFSMSAQF
jgi:hemolysin activation/secretion protein